MDIKSLLTQMTLEEKAGLCSGRDIWSTRPVERLGIPSVWMSDGPHGLRKAPTSDSPGDGNQLPATCFPTASALASTWDRKLIRRLGEKLAVECQHHNVQIILGPGANIKRTPLCGRNFEYFSEDPVLSGEIAAAFINGVQSGGVGACLKHYICNNQEYLRMRTSAVVDERSFREIYLQSFRIAIRKSEPWTIMASYNRFRGTYSTENPYLLKDVLKEELGYEGIVISDWMAVNDRVAGVKAGMHLEMPGSEGYNDRKIIQAVKDGILNESDLDSILEETLELIFKADGQRQETSFDEMEHHRFAEEVAGEAVVLLKNDNGILPFTKEKYSKILIVGDFADHPRYQGNGSSIVKPTRLDTFRDRFTEKAGEIFQIDWARGYNLKDDNDTSLIDEAVQKASAADICVILSGLPPQYESEEFDRKHIELPAVHNTLISKISGVCPRTAVVLSNGSAVTMPWIESVPAVLEAYLGGQAGAGAIADILLGNRNPSGKLAETFPLRLEDTPTFLSYPGENETAIYGEGIFVGYRHYQKKHIPVLFPFGHGLSYTEFRYDGIKVSKDKISNGESITVSFNITNTGSVKGSEVVQLYIRDEESTLQRPVMELKNFEKIILEPGETKTVELNISEEELMFYHPRFGEWIAETGSFQILIGSSSEDIRLSAEIEFNNTKDFELGFNKNTILRDFLGTPELREDTLNIFSDVLNVFKKGDRLQDDDIPDFFLDMPVIKYEYFQRIPIEKIRFLVDKASGISRKI